MRSLMMGTLAVLASITMAATGSAEETPTPIGAARPKIELAPPVRVTAFKRHGQTGNYSGGALGIAVDLENVTNKPIDNVNVKLVFGDKVLEQSVSVPPKGTRAAVFSDQAGLESSCSPKSYEINVALPNGTAFTKAARISPSCTFSSSIEESWNKMSPDKVEAEKAGNAYLFKPSIQAGAVCGKGPAMKVTVINQSSYASPSLIVQAKEWDADPKVRSQTSAAFPIASKAMKEVALEPVTNASYEPTDKLILRITDWTKSLKGRTTDGGIYVNTTRSCSLGYALD